MTSPPTTAPEIQQAIDAGLTTWPDVLRVLREDLHVPEGAIELWRAGDRDLGVVLVEWIERGNV